MGTSGGPQLSPSEQQDIIDGITWFKQKFIADVRGVVSGTPYTVDFVTAIAVQETFVIWGKARKNSTLSVTDILTACVGDPQDAEDGRDSGAFPANRAALEAVPNGSKMFEIARKALLGYVHYAPWDQRYADNPDKFCHGFGIFQYDIQSFLGDAGYFLAIGWANFSQCLGKFLKELNEKLNKYYPHASSLTDDQLIYVAIAYNQGHVDLDGGFDQGHFQDGYHYGQWIQLYLSLAKTTAPAV